MPDQLLSSDPRAGALLSGDPSAGVSEGWGSKLWRWATTPLLPQIQQTAQGLSDAITTHHTGESQVGSTLRGAAGGILEGIGNVLGDFTSPVGIATSAAGPILRGVRGGVRGAQGAAELLGGRSAADVLLGGPTTERAAQETLLGTRPAPSAQGIDDLIRMLDEVPQGSRDVGGTVPPRGSMLADLAEPAPRVKRGAPKPIGVDPEAVQAARAAQTPTSPYTRYGETGGTVDPLDTRFAARPQGTAAGELLSSDPFASPLDHATQPTFAEAPGVPHPPTSAVDTWEEALRGLDEAPELPTGESVPHTPHEDLGTMGQDPLSALEEFLGQGAQTPPTGSKPRIPAPVTGLWQKLRPEWTKSVAQQAGDEIPFTVDPHEDLVPFAKRVASDDPSVLMARERAVRKGLSEDDLRGILGDESGFIDPQMFEQGAEGLNKLRYFSMLSSPATQAKNVLGNVGAVLSHAAEHPRSAIDVLSEFFSPQTVRDAIAEYHRAPTGEGRWGGEQGVLGIPGRIMGAIDRGTKDALARGGVPADLAEEITFTNRPKSETGANLTDFLNRTPVAKLAVPFSRTATNIVERGLERTPGIGYLAEKLSGGNLQTSAAKQILGAIATAGGVAAGTDNPFVQAVLAPYSLPYSIGAGMAKAGEKRNSTGADVGAAAIEELLRMAPMPDAYSLSPSAWLASYVPNILRDINPMVGTDPSSFDTRHSLTGRAIAKIPFLNELLLHHKAKAPRAAPVR